MFVEFKQKETKRFFEVRLTSDAWAIGQGFKFEIVVKYAHNGLAEIIRFANIKKTVATVAIDEDASGNAVTEKWPIVFTPWAWINMTEISAAPAEVN